jgi:hypothetical protein
MRWAPLAGVGSTMILSIIVLLAAWATSVIAYRLGAAVIDIETGEPLFFPTFIVNFIKFSIPGSLWGLWVYLLWVT